MDGCGFPLTAVMHWTLEASAPEKGGRVWAGTSPFGWGCGRQTTGEEQGTLQGLPLREAPVSTGARASEMLDPQARLTFINSLQQSVFSKQ